ncbi:MAG: sigma-70 family RNA polymerase sigma factor, partial [Saonia sp.]
VWKKREKLDGSRSFRSFLFTMARNKSFDLLKKAANDLRLREEIFYRSQKLYDPTEKNKDNAIEKIKWQAVEQLPPKRKRIFQMSRSEGKSYDDIARELGISIHTVKSQMNKALKTVRAFLAIKGGW